MSKIGNFVKWADFFIDLKETVGSIRASLRGHDEALKELAQQNIRLVERIAYQNREIESLEKRLLNLESNAMVGSIPHTVRTTESVTSAHAIVDSRKVDPSDVKP